MVDIVRTDTASIRHSRAVFHFCIKSSDVFIRKALVHLSLLPPIMLLNLPNELCIAILRTVLPDDIESLTSTCRQFYQAAPEILERHRQLKARYRCVTLAAI